MAVANIPLNYFLISQNGAVGAPQATACAYAIGLALVWWVSARLNPLPWLSNFRISRPRS
jgi:Na+-driven multidrug efflux pump